MALQTKKIQLKKINAMRAGAIERAAIGAFRNKRPLALIATGVITAADYLATDSLRPDLGLLFNTYWSIQFAGNSLENYAKLEKNGYTNSSFAMQSAGATDIFNMGVSFLPFLSKVYGSGNNVKNGIMCMALLGVTTLAAQGIEKRARFAFLAERFGDAFQHMGIPECLEYLYELEKRERSWWRAPYWIVRPEKLNWIKEEKIRVSTYLENRMQSKSL
jgi:hypothetical protein